MSKIQYLSIQVLYEDLPKFLASDGKEYGDFRPNDMVIIPKKDALRLIQKEQAKELIMELQD